MLFPFTLIFLYLSTLSISGKVGGYFAVVLLGFNALILLHTRRAMAEGPLLLGITAVMVSWQDAPRRPWLAGLAIAFAFNAKQSAFALVPVGLLAVSWVSDGSNRRLYRIIGNLLQYGLAFTAITWLLNPVSWQHPFAAASAAVQARVALLSRQVADTQRMAPSQVLDQPAERVTVLFGHLYLTEPMFAESENYRRQTYIKEAAYLADPLNNLGRNYLGAGLFLAMTAVGISSAALQLKNDDPQKRRYTLLIILGTLSMAVGLLLTVPLPWQRYVLPLIPFACLWAGVGCSWVIQFPKLSRRI
jgi:hypothetical protein